MSSSEKDADAEIERLKEANKAITFQYLEARSLKAEIERLAEQNAHFAWRDADKQALLAECAQALALWKQTYGLPREHEDLLSRIREASK